MVAETSTTSTIQPLADAGSLEKARPAVTTGFPHRKEDHPPSVRFLSANVHGLNNKVPEVADWDADMTILQETKLTEFTQRKAGAEIARRQWRACLGQPVQARRAIKKAVSALCGTGGGVALVVSERKPVKLPKMDMNMIILSDEARWHEAAVAVDDGSRHISNASFYGTSGASSDAEKFRRNEELLTRALTKMLEVGQVPYFLAADLNVQVEQSPTLQRLTNKGLVIDVPAAYGFAEQHNFCQSGPLQGVEGPGRTRIDCVLANRAAFAITCMCESRWDLTPL